MVLLSYLFATVPHLNSLLHEFQIDIYAVVPLTLHTNVPAWWGVTIFLAAINVVLLMTWFQGGEVEISTGEMYPSELYDVRVFLQAAELKIETLKKRPAIQAALPQASVAG